MKNERIFLRCSICGNIIGIIESTGPTPFCCGQEMTLLVPNTVDAAHEKHVPVAKKTDSGIEVTVGAVPHPMTEEHHISWITLAGKSSTKRIKLEITDEPKVLFCVTEDEPFTVYEYCNLHGLWASDI